MYCCILTIFLRNTTEIFLSSKFDIEGVADITAARWYPFLSDGIQFLPSYLFLAEVVGDIQNKFKDQLMTTTTGVVICHW